MNATLVATQPPAGLLIARWLPPVHDMMLSPAQNP